MKHTLYIIYIAIVTTLLPMVFVGCADDSTDLEPRDVSICVQAVWQNGQAPRKAPGAMPATDILAAGTADITIAYADYPTTINVHCSDGTDFTLSKGSALCSAHSTFWSYPPSVIYKDQRIIKHDLTFTATATIDGGDELTGEATKANLHDQHLQFTLHHTKALLRFAFKVHEDYYRLRQVRVTAITLTPDGGDPITLSLKQPHMLTTDRQCIAYCYIAPMEADVLASQTFRISCTYDIYDKDDEPHLTRKGVTAQNAFKLSALKDSNGPVSRIQAGFYYDLNITLNPDYLYVLSEHDNKHLTIN